MSGCIQRPIQQYAVSCRTGHWSLYHFIRKILDKNKAAHEGIWNKDAKGSFELRGKKLGIIGYGNIGSQVSILAEAMGMKVIFYDVLTKLPLGNADARKSLKELVSESDIVTLHIPETSQTKNIINKSLLKQFKKGAILINFARGEVVDLDALSKSLQEGHLSGAAIDVFDAEPLAENHPLRTTPNTLLTPHLGFVAQPVFESFTQGVVECLEAWLNGQPVIRPLP